MAIQYQFNMKGLKYLFIVWKFLGAGGTQRLPRLVGISKAKELIYAGKVLDGNEAFSIGLVNQSIAQNENGDAAYQHALKFADEIAKNVIFIFYN